ncbi:glycosyl transferase, partial [Pseudomonas syringae]
MIFLYIVCLHLWRKFFMLDSAAYSSHDFLLDTSVRFDELSTALFYIAVIRVAIFGGLPTSIVCS